MSTLITITGYSAKEVEWRVKRNDKAIEFSGYRSDKLYVS